MSETTATCLFFVPSPISCCPLLSFYTLSSSDKITFSFHAVYATLVLDARLSFIRDAEVPPILDLGYCLLVETPALFCCHIPIFKTREEEGGKYRLLLDDLCAPSSKRQSREKGRAM